MSTDRNSESSDAPQRQISANRPGGSEEQAMPSGGSEEVGAAYNQESVRTGGNVVLGVVALVIAVVLIALFVLLVLNR